MPVVCLAAAALLVELLLESLSSNPSGSPLLNHDTSPGEGKAVQIVAFSQRDRRSAPSNSLYLSILSKGKLAIRLRDSCRSGDTNSPRFSPMVFRAQSILPELSTHE